MPNRTPNLSLNTWLESEAVDFEQVNENFTKIDDCVMCIESGTTTSNYTGGATNIANWRYKKWSDGTVDFSCKLEFTNIKCNGGTSSPYYSGSSTLYFPFVLSQVYDVQTSLSSNTIGWISNITGRSVLDSIMFRVMSTAYENDYIYKQVFISVKGVIG